MYTIDDADKPTKGTVANIDHNIEENPGWFTWTSKFGWPV